MKKLLFIIACCLAFQACSSQVKQDGVYPTENGWDLVYEGITYSYSCEPDGFYLYMDTPPSNANKNWYDVRLHYSEKVFCNPINRMSDFCCTPLKFLCKNKDGKYVYVGEWYNFGGTYQLSSIEFDLENGKTLKIPYKESGDTFKLFTMYTNK